WWTLIDLSARSGTPALAGNLVGAYVSGRVTISGTDANGDLWYIDQKKNGAWRSRDITAALSGPALTPGGLTGSVNRLGASFITGLSPAGELIAYRSIYKGAKLMARWSVTNVSASVGSLLTLAGPLESAFRWVDGTAVISATTADGHIVRFSFNPDTGWL